MVRLHTSLALCCYGDLLCVVHAWWSLTHNSLHMLARSITTSLPTRLGGGGSMHALRRQSSQACKRGEPEESAITSMQEGRT